MPALAPLLFCGAAVDGELSPEGGTRLTLDGWLQVDVSERAADLLLEAREQAGARWAAMLRSVRAGEGYGGRFTGGPLLEALQPLLKLRAQPILPPPKVEARRGRGREGGHGRVAVAAGGVRSRRRRTCVSAWCDAGCGEELEGQ